MLRLVLCNCTPEEAPHLAETLVVENLAACVNIIPGVTSYYRWEGKLQCDREHTLLIKTTADRYEALAARLQALHTYTTPEIVAFDAVEVLDSYLAWAVEQTRATSEE